jgi:hypothetical protein
MSKRKTSGKEVATTEPKREPNAREKRAIAAAQESRAARPTRAQYDEEPDGSGAFHLKARHNDENGHSVLVTETFGTTSGDFVGSALLQLAGITARNKKPSVEGLNASLALVGAIAPENELEAALASQMAATHELSMEMLRRTKVTDSREAMREYGNMATKLTRTFTTQMKALSDWRRGGEQVVRHVHVNEGGQAVVAETINIGGRQNEENSNRVHEPCAALRGPNAAGDAVPVPGHEGEAEVLPPRRRDRLRRAEGK